MRVINRRTIRAAPMKRIGKRQALAILSGMIGLMSGRAKAEGSFSTSNTMSIWRNEPQGVYFPLDSFKSYVFKLGDKELTFSPQEIFDALSKSE